MSDNPPFTLEELSGFSLDQLRKICGYLKIGFTRKHTHSVLIEKIWMAIKSVFTADNGAAGNPYPSIVIDNENRPASVRVARIYENTN